MTEIADGVARMHPFAAAAAERFASMVETALPGLVTGLHLVGSAALDDFVPGRCDLDFVAITVRRPDPGALADLHAVLASASDGPALDGAYLTVEDWRNPAGAGVGPSVRAGRFELASTHRRRPVDRLALVEHAITLRGPLPSWQHVPDLEPWALDAARALPASVANLDTDEVVLAACRLHFLLATRRIASKSEAGLYGLIAFDERWRRIVDEALRLRRSPGLPSLYPDADARSRDAVAFVGMATQDAMSLA